MGIETMTVLPTQEQMDNHIFEEPAVSGRWNYGPGDEFLKKARQDMKGAISGHIDDLDELGSGDADPVVIEGMLDGQTVFREGAPKNSILKDMDDVPDDRRQEVNYVKVAYKRKSLKAQ